MAWVWLHVFMLFRHLSIFINASITKNFCIFTNKCIIINLCIITNLCYEIAGGAASICGETIQGQCRRNKYNGIDLLRTHILCIPGVHSVPGESARLSSVSVFVLSRLSKVGKLRKKQKKMARETGLEPATPTVTGWYSNQLSYSPA